MRREILSAMAVAPLPHRSPPYLAMVRRIQDRLAQLLRTQAAVFPVLGSGTTALEVAITGVARRRVLVASGGAFGDRLARVARAVGLDVEQLAVPPGWPIEPELVARGLGGGEFDTVCVAHCETQTGALSDVATIGEVVASHPGTAFVVDAVSSFGGTDIEFDSLGPEAVLVSASGKALACPPGVALIAVSEGAAERAARATTGGYALRLESLVEQARRGQTPQTPSTPLLHALDTQLPRVLAEGIHARAARHAQMAARVAEWADGRLDILARPDVRSPTVTALENTLGLDIPALLLATERRGFRIADGYGDLKGATFRIGHMGDVTIDETDALLAALDEAIAEIT